MRFFPIIVLMFLMAACSDNGKTVEPDAAKVQSSVEEPLNEFRKSLSKDQFKEDPKEMAKIMQQQALEKYGPTVDQNTPWESGDAKKLATPTF